MRGWPPSAALRNLMIVAVSVFELHLPRSRSLKEKRRVVKSLIERIHSRHRVSIAEVDHHDLLQLTRIGIAAVNASRLRMERQMESIRALIDQVPEAVLLSWEPQYLEGAP